MASPLRKQFSRTRKLVKTWVRSTKGAVARREQFATVETYCMFVGYPRSGHSLVGSLLDAHPEAVIAHELDAVRYLRQGFRRAQIWSLILDTEATFSAKGHQTNHEYAYAVPGQWQGRWETLRVIGDKKGRNSTLQIRDDPKLLDRVKATMRVPVRFVHVIRNPYDNIATMQRRFGGDLERALREYADLAETNDDIRRRLGPDELYELRHEDLLTDPAPAITGLVEHVGLKVPEGYVEACSGILFPSPKRTRTSVRWTDADRDRVDAIIERHEFLAGYDFDS